jgi:aspartate aminotransferase
VTPKKKDPEISLSRNIHGLMAATQSAMRQEARKRRAAGDEVLDLACDGPRMNMSRHMVDAAQRAAQQHRMGIASDAGLLELRVAIARHLSLLSGGRPVNADNIVISNGARQALFEACFSLFGSSDEVLVPAPTWRSIPQAVRLSRAKPIRVPGDVEWSMKVGVDQLNRAATPDTVGLVVCSPVNPTGAVYTRAELKAIVEWAVQRGCWVIADEVSRRIHFGSGAAPSVLDLPDELLERVVVIGGPSKTYSLGGWRLGYSLAPAAVARSMATLQSHVTGGAALPSQWACVCAYSDERVESEVVRRIEEIRLLRDLAVNHFRRQMPGIEFVDPLGGIHLLFRVEGCYEDGVESARAYCERLLAQKGVLLVPGDEFGAAGWVRLSYAVPERELVSGLERICEMTPAVSGEAE